MTYKAQWLRGDLLAGITVTAYLIPQCMAYGELAGVKPVVGLWAIMPAMVIYALLGSSPQLSMGPESTTAILTAAAVAPFVAPDGSNYAALTSLLAVLVGIICLLGYWARLGFLAELFSKPLLIGYMAGVAVMMIVGQLGKIGGIAIHSESIFGQILEFLNNFSQIHQPTFILAISVLVVLFVIDYYLPHAPAPLISVLLATIVVRLFHLEQYGIAVVGSLPAGLPHFVIPNSFSLKQMIELISSAMGLAIVCYSDNVLTARIFAVRNSYKINPNQELLALGMANIGTGLMQGFPVSSSGSRTVIGDSLGSKTQLFSLVALVCVILVLLFLRPLLSLFPKAALGAIVIYAAVKLIDIREFRRLRKFKGSELILAIMTTLGVLATNILVGVGIAIGLSVSELFARVARPHDAVLGEVPDLPGFHDIDDWKDAKTIPGLVIYRYDAPLFFANADNFKRRALAAIAAEKTLVEWFVLNTEANVEIDLTAADMLEELRQELQKMGITMALARVKQDLFVLLKRTGLVERIGLEHIYPTIHTAIAGFHSRHQQ